MRILFATDGSNRAGQALQLLTSSFEPARVESVEVIAVVPRVPAGPDAGSGAVPHTLIEPSHRDAAGQQLRAAAQLLRAAGFEAVETICAGRAAETIVIRAIAGRPDLIVLGSRGPAAMGSA